MPSRDRKEQRERSEDAIDRRPDDRSIVLRVSVSPLSVTCESDALHVLRLSIYLGRKHMGHASKSWYCVLQEETGQQPNVKG